MNPWLETLHLVLLAIASTTLWLALARRRYGPEEGRVRAAAGALLEWLGLTALFYAADVALGIALTLGLRATVGFVSMYVSTDASLVALAAVQAFLFRAWRG